MEDEKKKKTIRSGGDDGRDAGIWMLLGAAAGALFGSADDDRSLGTCTSIGMILGLAIGAGMHGSGDRRKK